MRGKTIWLGLFTVCAMFASSIAIAALSQVAVAKWRGDHVVALRDDGRVLTWGYNAEGQLGDGANAARTLPYLVTDPQLVNVVQVAAGTYHSLALRYDGFVFAWGLT